MPRTYNYIYDKLVKDENDLSGMAAYCIYKQKKVAYIKDFEDRHGRPPEEADLKVFYHIIETHHDDYEKQGEELLMSQIDLYYQIKTKDLEDIIGKWLRPKTSRFWMGVLQGVIATLITPLVLFLIAWAVAEGQEISVLDLLKTITNK